MATEKLQLYKCEICGNLVQVLISGAGELVCCSQPMKLLVPQHDSDELGEKHAPKIEIREDGKYVHVKTHPMEDEHYIQFIEIYPKDKSALYLKYFNPHQTPEFKITCQEEVNALENCNIHGLWGEDNND